MVTVCSCPGEVLAGRTGVLHTCASWAELAVLWTAYMTPVLLSVIAAQFRTTSPVTPGPRCWRSEVSAMMIIDR